MLWCWPASVAAAHDAGASGDAHLVTMPVNPRHSCSSLVFHRTHLSICHTGNFFYLSLYPYVLAVSMSSIAAIYFCNTDSLLYHYTQMLLLFQCLALLRVNIFSSFTQATSLLCPCTQIFMLLMYCIAKLKIKIGIVSNLYIMHYRTNCI